MKCKETELIGWLYDVLNSLEWRISPLDVLDTEKRYPGLMDDLSVESWQRRIVKEQVDSELDKKDDRDSELDKYIDGQGER